MLKNKILLSRSETAVKIGLQIDSKVAKLIKKEKFEIAIKLASKNIKILKGFKGWKHKKILLKTHINLAKHYAKSLRYENNEK